MSCTTASPHPLIVEDDRDTFEWMHRRLESYGFKADWAWTLAEGIAALDRGNVCCVILDLKLPDGSGAEILRKLRENASPVKVAVVSGTEDNAALSDAALLKPDAFFIKPVDFIELVTWLESVRPCT